MKVRGSLILALVEKAHAFYRDPEYAPLVKLRQRGSDLDLVVVEGV